MNQSEVTKPTQDLRAEQLTLVTSHPRSIALLVAYPSTAVPWTYAASQILKSAFLLVNIQNTGAEQCENTYLRVK